MPSTHKGDQLGSVVDVGGFRIHLDLFSSGDGECRRQPDGKVICMKRKHIIGALLAMILLAVFVYFYGGSQAPSGQSPLRSLTAQNVDDVKSEFNAAKDNVRVLLLLSPT
jgi:hypothetical protein